MKEGSERGKREQLIVPPLPSAPWLPPESPELLSEGAQSVFLLLRHLITHGQDQTPSVNLNIASAVC